MLNHSTGLNRSIALQYGMFVKAAYDVYKANPSNLNPSQSDYPSFPDGYKLFMNIQMTDFFGNKTFQNYYGFIAQSTTNAAEFVIAIRGTQTWQEWWDDFHWEPVPFPYKPNSGKVANGFIKIYETLAVSVPQADKPLMLLKDTVNASNEINLSAPSSINALSAASSITAIGHSLGSSLITLYAAQLAAAGKVNPLVYTFASPRVGDTFFAAFYNSTVGTNYRIYNWPDLVPRFPKDLFDKYQQVNGGYEVDSLEYANAVKPTVDCFHSLNTYLFLLGAPDSILGGVEGCGY